MKKILAAVGLVTFLVSSQAAEQLILTTTVNFEGGKPRVEGVTNLPDGTELIVTISRTASAYVAQDKTTVQKGRFFTSSFSSSGNALNPGGYKIDISTSIADFQPKSVRDAIGKDYSNFKSHHFRKSSLGTYLSYEFAFNVPGQSSSAADAAARRDAERAKEAWIAQSCRQLMQLEADKANWTIQRQAKEVAACLAAK